MMRRVTANHVVHIYSTCACLRSVPCGSVGRRKPSPAKSSHAPQTKHNVLHHKEIVNPRGQVLNFEEGASTCAGSEATYKQRFSRCA